MNKIKEIQNHLIAMYDSETWENFVDNCELGDCQFIAKVVKDDFKQYNIEHVFGEIEIDEPYIDDYGDEQDMMTHHWNLLDGDIVDFSKGTLAEHIEFDDIYDPENIE